MPDNEQPQRITISDGDTSLTLAPSIGGSITRYWSENRRGETFEWMRPASDQDLADGELRGMSSFPLVPFSNRIREGRFTFQGRDVALPLNFLPERHAIHGQGWKLPWTVTEQSANALTIAYDEEAGPWPYPYHGEQSFRLNGDVLEQTISVRNTGDQDMPLGLGVHPYFIRTPRATVTAAVSQMWAADEETMPRELGAPPPPKQPGEGIVADAVAIDNLYVGWQHQARVAWPEWNASLVIRAGSPLDNLVIFTPPGEDFFCVEPVTNIIDAFNFANAGRTDTGMITLAPGQTQVCTMSFTPSHAG